MDDLSTQLAELEAKAEAVRRQIAQGPCVEYGHSWKSIGGRNAGCGDACCCSVPVHVCEKCGDCDYGDNDEAGEIRAGCLTAGTSS